MKNSVRYNNIEYFMPFLFCNDIFIPILHKLLENEINPVKYLYGGYYSEWGTGTKTISGLKKPKIQGRLK